MIIVIVGPTGVGKTKLSLALAKTYNTELISGDSVQVYKGLDIGSAKVTASEQEEVKHHMIDTIDPREEYSVALYQKEVRNKIEQFEQEQKLPIIVGGTGFYIKSVLHDFDFENSARDNNFEAHYQSHTNAQLFQVLQDYDEEAIKHIHPNNRKRVLQALYRAMHGTKISETREAKPLYDYLIIGLNLERETLYERIDKRVDIMFESGLVEEVKRLYDAGVNTQAVTAIGYKELYQYFDKTIDLSEAKRLIKRNSRRYAKRQFTYFNNQLDVSWINVNLDDFDSTIQKAKDLIKEHLK